MPEESPETNPYAADPVAAESRSMSSPNSSIVRFALAGFLTTYVWWVAQHFLEQGTTTALSYFTSGLIMAAAATFIGTLIYGAISWILPNLCSLRIFSAVVFFVSMGIVAVVVERLGFTGPPGLITLPLAIIATIAAERLVPRS